MSSPLDMLPRPRLADELARALDGGRRPSAATAQLVQLVSSLDDLGGDVSVAARPEFRASLRARLESEAAALGAAPAGSAGAAVGRRPARSRRRERAAVPVLVDRRAPVPAWLRAVGGVLAVLLLAGTGTAVASSSALPGDTLYGVKRGIESVALALTQSDSGRGQRLLDEASTRMSEIERLVAGSGAGTPEADADVVSTFEDLRSETVDGATTLVEVYRATGDGKALRSLEDVLPGLRDRLYDSMPRLPAAVRPQASLLVDQLRDLTGQIEATLESCESPCDAVPRRPGGQFPVIRLPFGAASSSLPAAPGTANGSPASSGDGSTGTRTGGPAHRGTGGGDTAAGSGAGAGGGAAGGAVSGVDGGGVSGAVGGVVGGVGGVVSGATGAVGGAVSGATGAVGGVVSGATGAVGSAVTGATGAVGSAVTGATGAVGGATGAVGGVVSGGTGAVGGVVSGATGAAGGATGVIGGATGVIGSATGLLP